MRPPSGSELKRIAEAFQLTISAADLDGLVNLCAGLVPAYDCLDRLESSQLPVKYPRGKGRAPVLSENPFNAWAWLSEIPGAKNGPLTGRRVGIKDNIAVAGLPMRNGSQLFDGFVPDEDATVVTRILDAGGIVAGKTVCEDLCFSGGSHTSKPRAVLNPNDTGRSAGGSSSGNAAAIAAGDVDMCVGGDQGGSVRTPASWSGVVGLKPTHGLVPYTGAFPIEPSFDHLGPMGRTVEDVALLLSVIAGSDGLDPRQGKVMTHDYRAAAEEPLSGLRIAILREGFGRPESDPQSDAIVRKALGKLAKAGATVEEISVPWHIDGYHVGTVAIMEGAGEFLYNVNAMGVGFKGRYPAALVEHWTRAWHAHPNELPDIGKFALLFTAFMRENHWGRYYAKAQNLRSALRAAYDEALNSHDVLAMPTIPFTAPLLPSVAASLEEIVTAGLNMEGNTAPFDASGHPAISVPCGLLDGLPVGLMFVGRHFDERSVLRAAASFERIGNWRTLTA
jgi:amidase